MKKLPTMLKKMLRLLLAVDLIFVPTAAFAAANIPGFYGSMGNLVQPSANQLPVIRSIVSGVSGLEQLGNNHLIVHQDQSKAVLDWQSFDIGANAWVHFDQTQYDAENDVRIPQTDWSALNRIYDRNPSQIFGRMTADGTVFLINQNGMLFSKGSRVDVHGLVASALNVSNDDFLSNTLRFRTADYNKNSDNSVFDSVSNVSGVVANHGTINTDELGDVFLIGSRVENSGTIDSPLGQVGLIAGNQVDLFFDETASNRVALTVAVADVQDGEYRYGSDTTGDTQAGVAINTESGKIYADIGLAGMYGRVVNQDGLIRSVTAIKRNGNIELLASEKISTGTGSITACSVSDSIETVNQTFTFSGGKITLDGLDPESPAFPQIHPSVIEHKGQLLAPSGTIRLKSQNRILLESGSNIDVSGNNLSQSADGGYLSVQLNSQELKNEHNQQDSFLKGKTIEIDAHLGSAIGDVSGALVAEEVTALERSVVGGNVELEVISADGDIIIKPEAIIDISGGSINYASGLSSTSRLLSGRHWYDIHDAPEWLTYDALIGKDSPQQQINERFGIVENYEGLYFGGAVALGNYNAAYIEGYDAGYLQVLASRILYEGGLAASAIQGIFQTDPGPDEPTDDLGYQIARGRVVPKGGTLSIGRDPGGSIGGSDYVVDQISILTGDLSASRDLSANFESTPYPDALNGRSIILDDIINDSGINDLQLYANTSIVIESGATVKIAPGGLFRAYANQIDLQGKIYIPSGSINVKAKDTIIDSMTQRIVLSEGSVLSTAGARYDFGYAELSVPFVEQYAEGGTIAIEDDSLNGEGVIINRGAVIDVSGGYRIDNGGDINGAPAGSLEVAGSAVIISGDLLGHSLEGQDGGRISLHAQNVTLSSETGPIDSLALDEPIPDTLIAQLKLNPASLKKAGFSDIAIVSEDDLLIAPGVILEPSNEKMAQPRPTNLDSGQLPNNVPRFADAVIDGPNVALVQVADHEAGNSSFTLAAGVPIHSERPTHTDAAVILSENSTLHLFPGGELDIQGPSVSIQGTIEAPGADVNIRATLHDLLLSDEASILAHGYSTAVIRQPGLGPTYEVHDGGTVNLEAANGRLALDPESVIDVSGSAAVPDFSINLDGSVAHSLQAGNPGAVQMVFHDLSNNGTILGKAGLNDSIGGSLSLYRSNPDAGMEIHSHELSGYHDSGFDTIRLGSMHSLVFCDSAQIAIDRQLTLDAPVITTAGGFQVVMNAPWIKIQNSYWPTAKVAESGISELQLKGSRIDVEGDVLLDGFQNVYLLSDSDIILSEHYYQLGSDATFGGRLELPGNLTTRANRIYPTTLSQFTIDCEKLTTLAGSDRSAASIFSAAGHLTVSAENIDHRGVIAAPMGELTFHGPGGEDDPIQRFYLAEGSIISTAGTSAVNLGRFEDPEQVDSWIAYSGTSRKMEIESTPRKSIEITGNEVLLREGATIDISGGGSVFAYAFQPGIEGTSDPIGVLNQYVILPDNPISAIGDGKAVYLENVTGLSDGLYSLLPTSYAFQPGAVVIQITGKNTIQSNDSSAQNGGLAVNGYMVDSASGLRMSGLQTFVMRAATEVLAEGTFMTAEQIAGESGALAVKGNTTVFGSVLNAGHMDNFNGATVTLSGRDVIVGDSTVALPEYFIFSSKFEDFPELELIDKLIVDPQKVSVSGIDTLYIGDLETTKTITVESGSHVSVSNVTLSASDTIRLSDGSVVSGSDPNGNVRLVAPNGSIIIDPGARLHASNEITLDSTQLSLLGELTVDNSALTIIADAIHVINDAYSGSLDSSVLYLTDNLWQTFESIENVGLSSRSDLVFFGDIDLATANALTLDAARIAGNNADVQINAEQIFIKNSQGAQGIEGFEGSGNLSLSANRIVVGEGSMSMEGFTAVHINGQSEITFKGSGLLDVDADLYLSANRITAASVIGDSNAYRSADFKIDAGYQNTIEISFPVDSTHPDVSGAAPVGGNLEFAGKSILHGGRIEVPAGNIIFRALGSGTEDGVFLKNGSETIARGAAMTTETVDERVVDFFRAGSVQLDAGTGVIDIEAGASIDVSNLTKAKDYGLDTEAISDLIDSGTMDAGLISIRSPNQMAVLNGSLKGASYDGHGGSFFLDADGVSVDRVSTDNDVGSLMRMVNSLVDAGAEVNDKAIHNFSKRIDMRIRSGDALLSADTHVTTEEFRLALDNGRLDLFGGIQSAVAGGNENGGGAVELYAGNDVRLHAGSTIDVSNAAGAGGRVVLHSDAGMVAMHPVAEGNAAALINLSGKTSDGILEISASRLDTDADNVDDHVSVDLGGIIEGASEINIEAFRVYGDGQHDGVIDTETTNWFGQANDFMTAFGEVIRADIQNRVGSGDHRLGLFPGIYVEADGDLTIAGNGLNLSAVRFGLDNVPAHVTIRAGRDLSITQSITDDSISSAEYGTSNITLVAGADLNSADPFSTIIGTGDLTVENGKAVLTTDGCLRFASGNDTVVGPSSSQNQMVNSIPFSIGTYSGNIIGHVNGDLKLAGSAIQTTTGDIRVSIAGDLLLNQGAQDGSIRTLGTPVPGGNKQQYWKYVDGGDIYLEVGGSVSGVVNNGSWDFAYDYTFTNENGERVFDTAWGPSFNGAAATTGIATLSGGDLTVLVGADYRCQTGTFGTGDLTIFSGGTVDGRFLNRDGSLHIASLENFGPLLFKDPVLELFDTQAHITALGDVEIGAIANPTLARDGFSETKDWNLTYTEDSRVRIRSVSGDITIKGEHPYYTAEEERRYRILPPHLELAAGRDIHLLAGFALAPAPDGNLRLLAGGDIDSGGSEVAAFAASQQIVLPDIDPDSVFGDHSGEVNQSGTLVNFTHLLFDAFQHADTPVHLEDDSVVTVKAGNDLSNLQFYLSKSATIQAGGSIRDIFYLGQNISSNDITRFIAGVDIIFSALTGSTLQTGIEHGGPGLLIVNAANEIDLGASDGIRTVGSQYTRYQTDDPRINGDGSSLIVISGYEANDIEETIGTFFQQLKESGEIYSNALSLGDIEEAESTVAAAREEIIDPLFGEAYRKGSGDINMVNSQINTSGGANDVFIAAGGKINVGKSTITVPGAIDSSDSKSAGIYTAAGGAINIFSRGDLNVNESKVMTYYGGDITVWSDEGSINAGRGSRASINAEPPKLVLKDGVYSIQFVPPAVGSGIRTLTFDADGIEGPEPEPEAGSAYLFAPSGEIDAGEAGISAKNVILGALDVINAQNIEVSGTSVGVPDTTATGSNIGALAGAGVVSESSAIAEEQAGLAGAQERFSNYVKDLAETLVPKWIAVEVVGFGDAEAVTSDQTAVEDAGDEKNREE